MRKILMIVLILAVAVVASGCAMAKPKIYVLESELPKTKLVAVEVTTYEKFEERNGEFTFTNQTNEEYGKVFKEAFKKELEEKGFVVLSGASADIKKQDGDFLLIRVSLSNKPPIIPLFSNGFVACTAIVEKNGRIVWRVDGGNFTDPPIITVFWVVKKATAPGLAKTFVKSFN